MRNLRYSCTNFLFLLSLYDLQAQLEQTQQTHAQEKGDLQLALQKGEAEKQQFSQTLENKLKEKDDAFAHEKDEIQK